MKRTVIMIAVFCLLLTGCAFGGSEQPAAPTENHTATAPAATQVAATEPVPAKKVAPLTDTTMENLTDAILAVSLEESGIYEDESGALCMELTIYTYARYDMVDMASLEVGDVLVTWEAEVPVKTLERTETGAYLINGGLDNGGFELVTDDSGTFYEQGLSDAKNWYEVGRKSFQVSDAFAGTDHADLDLGELPLTQSSFTDGGIAYFDFTPHNTTVRLENGLIVALDRVYTP